VPNFFNKNIPKTLSYFLGELFVVVLGIFIAVQLNNWNENRKEKKEVSKALKSLLSDLQTEKYVLKLWKEHLNKSIDYLNEITTDSAHGLDSIPFYLDSEYYHQKINASYINLKFGGNLNTISNDTLKYVLTSFYEAGYDAHDAFSRSHTAFIHNNVRPYILSEFLINKNNLADVAIVKTKLKDKSLLNLINSQISAYQHINTSLLDTVRLNSIIKVVEKEITKTNQ